MGSNPQGSTPSLAAIVSCGHTASGLTESTPTHHHHRHRPHQQLRRPRLAPCGANQIQRANTQQHRRQHLPTPRLPHPTTAATNSSRPVQTSGPTRPKATSSCTVGASRVPPWIGRWQRASDDRGAGWPGAARPCWPWACWRCASCTRGPCGRCSSRWRWARLRCRPTTTSAAGIRRRRR